MKYIGIQTQKRRNNLRSTAMLTLFPCVILFITWLFFRMLKGPDDCMDAFKEAAPWVMVICALWFAIAYFANTQIISASTGSKPLLRRENKRVYNLVENICMATNTSMPKINVIEDDALNAFASGLNRNTFTVTLSRGIINKLDDAELEAVIAHELSHIRNNDVKVLIIAIVFVGLLSLIVRVLFLIFQSGHFKSSGGKGGGLILLLAVLLLIPTLIGLTVTTLMRFAISRKREYLADAGAAEMTRNPMALASALRKITDDPCIKTIKHRDVAQLFIDNPWKEGDSFLDRILATHPPVAKRIQVLEQF